MNTTDLIEDLFQQGLDLSPTDRQALLAAHTSRPNLVTEVEALWANSDEDDPIFDFEALPHLARAVMLHKGRTGEHLPTSIAGFRILSRLGGGGMGSVFKAEQREPILREVAIKVLDRVVISEELHRRFRDEQRALARLAHPNVATVYDTGFTQEGQPFFAMEYLPGATLTTYCAEHKLPLDARLNLFRAICTGVQHAHVNGIAHRDLKPGNILVTERDGMPTPKIIDFGVAKLNDNTDLPQQTQLGMIIGTPAYMSPEQAAGRSETGIDARTDIYSLGVLLYELLTGETPHGAQIDKVASMRAACRIVEEEPVKPAHQRKPSIGKELSWICTKALTREPAGRYQSAAQLSEDIRRYQSQEPIAAIKPTAGYALRKLLARYKWYAGLAASLLLSLVLGLAGTTGMWLRAESAEMNLRTALDKQIAVSRFSENIFARAVPGREGPDATASMLLEAAARDVDTLYRDHPDLEAAMRSVLGACYKGLGVYEKARIQYEQASLILERLHGPHAVETLTCGNALAYIHYKQGRWDQAEKMYRTNYEILQTNLSDTHHLALQAGSGLAEVLGALGAHEEALTLFETILPIQAGTLPPEDETHSATRNNYSLLLLKQNQAAKAEDFFTKALAIHLRYRGPKHPLTASTHHNLGLAKQKQGQLDASLTHYRKAMAIRNEVLGSTHRATLNTINSLAVLLGDNGKPAEAVAILAPLYTSLEDRTKPEALLLGHNLGNNLMLLGKHGEADKQLREVWAHRSEVLGKDHPHTLVTWVTVGENLMLSEQSEEAVAVLREAVAAAERRFGVEDASVRAYRGLLVQAKERLN